MKFNTIYNRQITYRPLLEKYGVLDSSRGSLDSGGDIRYNITNIFV